MMVKDRTTNNLKAERVDFRSFSHKHVVDDQSSKVLIFECTPNLLRSRDLLTLCDH